MRGSSLPISHTTDRAQAATLLRMGRILNFIKGLETEGIDLPTPDPDVRSRLEETDRRAVGIRLLGWFLKDGKIRGLKSDGRVYEHMIDRELTRLFLYGLEAAGVSRRKATSKRSKG